MLRDIKFYQFIMIGPKLMKKLIILILKPNITLLTSGDGTIIRLSHTFSWLKSIQCSIIVLAYLLRECMISNCPTRHSHTLSLRISYTLKYAQSLSWFSNILISPLKINDNFVENLNQN